MERLTILEKACEAFPNFVIIDQDCRVVYLNEIYASLLGVNAARAVGKDVTEVIPGTRLPEVVHSGKAEIGAVMTLYHHGKGHDVSVVCNRIPLREGKKVIGAVAVTTFDEESEVMALREELLKMQEVNSRYRETIRQMQKTADPLDGIVGNSQAIREAKSLIEGFADSNMTILLTGETGVGKEVFADAIRETSSRRLQPFVKINCAAIPHDLLESELFGYEAGAFTGARAKGKPGRFELADGGTILLDEIGEMPLDLQAKFLRVLQEREVERIGGGQPRKIDVRVICSTNRNIPELVRAGRFRSDLYYRINTVELEIPPLRERLEDLTDLSLHFISKLNREEGLHTMGISPDVIRLFSQYSWPGNVRELGHVVERLAYMNRNSIITERDCGFFRKRMQEEAGAAGMAGMAAGTDADPRQNKSMAPGGGFPAGAGYGEADPQQNRSMAVGNAGNGLPGTGYGAGAGMAPQIPAEMPFSIQRHIERQERSEIIQALLETKGNKSKAAKMLGIDRTTLYNRIRKYGLQ